MFFCFTCGPQDFMTDMKGYQDMRIQCQRCHNASAVPQKRWTWFTFCFLPLFPVYRKKLVWCPVCRTGVETSEEQLDAMRHQGPALVGGQPQQHHMNKLGV